MKCKHCNKQIENPSSKQRFCNKKCHKTFKSRPNGKSCQRCGKPLVGYQEKWCGHNCLSVSCGYTYWKDSGAKERSIQKKLDYIASVPTLSHCIVCGQLPTNRHFHHLNPSKKKFEVGRARSAYTSFGRWKREIDKCVCACAAHHLLVEALILDPHITFDQLEQAREWALKTHSLLNPSEAILDADEDRIC